jgi:WD40 repeat protein
MSTCFPDFFWKGGDAHASRQLPRGVGPSLVRRIFDQATHAPTLRVQAVHLRRPADFIASMDHRKSVRGHRFAVYCVAFDKLGQKIITGSDDRLVKVHTKIIPLPDLKQFHSAVACLKRSNNIHENIMLWERLFCGVKDLVFPPSRPKLSG